MRDNSFADSLNGPRRTCATLAARLNAGELTAGKLLKDERLYENMNGAVGDLRKLLTEIKKDPKKYLSVRVSIF